MLKWVGKGRSATEYFAVISDIHNEDKLFREVYFYLEYNKYNTK